jgi:hypothetical protein
MLFFATVRIIATSSQDPQFYSEGTGFIYDASRTAGVTCATLVTARHVIEGATEVVVRLLLRTPEGAPDLGRCEDVTISGGAAAFTHHPNPQVDVSVMAIELPLRLMALVGRPVFGVGFNPENCPTERDLEEIDAIEEITFVGYPDALFDSANHTPVARRGVTATPIQLDWCGAPHFLIDANVIPGSSGSPVVLLRPAAYNTSVGLSLGKPRLIFLGVLRSVYETPAEVEGSDVRPGASVRVAIGLGVVEKWTAVEETLDAMFAAEKLDREKLAPTPIITNVQVAPSVPAQSGDPGA